MADLGTLRTQVLAHQFSEAQYATYCDEMLNEAQLLLASEIDYRQFFQTNVISVSSGDAAYDLPTDYLRGFTLVDSETADDLLWLSVEDFDIQPAQDDRPSYYTIDGTGIRLWPTPNEALDLTLRYFRTPAEMDDDADVPEIPERDHKLLRSYALARCFERENDTTQGQYHEGEWERGKQIAKGQAQNDTQDRSQPERVQGLWHG